LGRAGGSTHRSAQLSPWLEGRSHLHPAVHRAQDAIAADPARAWSLAALGRVAGASPRNLSRLFMAHAGQTVTDAVNRGRVAMARDLIGQSSLGMEAVAERAGFSSARHMRRVWRQFHPQPPSTLRGQGTVHQTNPDGHQQRRWEAIYPIPPRFW